VHVSPLKSSTMRLFGPAIVAVTSLFVGPIVALPTANNAAVMGSLQDALEILGDNSMLEKRGFLGKDYPGTGRGIKVPLCKLDNVQVPVGEGIDTSDTVTGGRH